MDIQNIPDELIYEVINEKPFYYKRWREVVNEIETFESIRGSSVLQSYIVFHLNTILFLKIGLENYLYFSGRGGIHVDFENELVCDLAIYSKDILTADKITTKYVDVPAKVYIEVDIKADAEDLGETGYIHLKNQKLLEFGAEKVIWILTKPKQIIVTTKSNQWDLMDWNEDVELIEDQTFNIGKHFEEEGINPNI